MVETSLKGLRMRVTNGRWTPASVAIMLTVLRRNGIVEMIDDACIFDRDQRVLTPGEAVLLIIGATALRNRRIPLYKIGRQYESMNLKGILGREVSVESISDTALSRALDTIYKADREKLFWMIAEKMEKVQGLNARIFHLDQTKIRTYIADTPECDPEAAKPVRGLDKEGRTDFLLYSSSSMTSEFGNIRYFVPDDGNASDSKMDRDAIEFLVDAVDPKKCTVVTDCKGTNSELIALMDDSGLGFVSKVPENYSSRLRSRVIGIANSEELFASRSKKGYAFNDVAMMVEKDQEDDRRTRQVRCVAFTSAKIRRDGRKALVKRGLKTAESVSKNLAKARFTTSEDAMLAVGLAQESLSWTGCALLWRLESEEVRDKRPGRGRPPKDQSATFHTEWRIESEPAVDDEMADIVSELTSWEVLITNLPCSDPQSKKGGDVRDGSSPETVLRLYAEQYKQEHNFSLLKGKVGLAQVFVSKPERANAMMFVLGLAALIRNIIDGCFSREHGMFTTSQDMIDKWTLVRIRSVGGEMEIDGGGDVENEMYDTMRRLGLDEGMVLGSIAAV